jgi:hypothetical protein
MSSSRSSDYLLAFTSLPGFKHEADAGTTRKIRVERLASAFSLGMEPLFAPIVMNCVKRVDTA